MLNADSECDRCFVMDRCHLAGSLPLLCVAEEDSRLEDGKNPLAMRDPPPIDETEEGRRFLTDMLLAGG